MPRTSGSPSPPSTCGVAIRTYRRRCAAARRRPLRQSSRRPRFLAQRRPSAPARAGQGIRRSPEAADPRRADRSARRIPSSASSTPSASSLRMGRRSSTSLTGSARFARSPTGSRCFETVRNRGTSAVKDISDGDLLALIIGRALEATFPPKRTAEPGEDTLLRVEGLSGHGFDDISLTVGKGEIVGLVGCCP